MKLKRAKRARKILSFLRSAHGFKPPFDVLVDGTAIQASLNHGVALPDALPKVLGGNVRLLVPRAVVAELHVLGRKFAAAAKTARRLKVIDDDAAAASAADALVALVADGNARRRFVMTEDTDVRQRLAQLPAVPLLRFARSQTAKLLIVSCVGLAAGFHMTAPPLVGHRRAAISMMAPKSIEAAASACLEDGCSVDDVASLLQELKAESAALSKRNAEVLMVIGQLQALSQDPESNKGAIEKVVDAAARSFSLVDAFDFPGEPLGYTGKVGTTTRAGNALS